MCTANYTGNNCETFDVCLYSSCSEQATCVIVNGIDTECVCPNGLQGKDL